jgi:hypothetical protein
MATSVGAEVPGAMSNARSEALPASVMLSNQNTGLFDVLDVDNQPKPSNGLGGGDHTQHSVSSTADVDERTKILSLFPAGLEEWPMEVGVATSLPMAIKQQDRGRATAHALASHSEFIPKDADRVLNNSTFLMDTCCFKTQIPSNCAHLLRDIRKIHPIPLRIAGTETPVVTQAGWMDFQLDGRDEIFSVEVLLNPTSDLCLFANDDFESIKPPEGGYVEVNFRTNQIKFGNTMLPLHRIDGAPCIIPKILSSTPAHRHRAVTLASCLHPGAAEEAFQYVHRVCAHANPATCVRTAKKAKGFPQIVEPSANRPPCSECALGKMTAPRKGQGNLSTGLRPTEPGQLLSADVFGKLQVKGIRGEQYFITVSCANSGWGAVRCFHTKDQVPSMLEEIVLEARATRRLIGELVITLHSDNDSVFRSAENKSRMKNLKVILHFAVPWEPRTNPYAERYGGVLLPMCRALMLEGCYPMKFWSIIVLLACWILNRLVRPSGNAPIETFALQSIDFTNVHPTGVLCYWYISKDRRTDPKLGVTAGVGVYIGPAAIHRQSGHLVISPAGRIICTAHVRVNNAVQPFRVGLTAELIARSNSFNTAFDDSTIDPDAYIQFDGVNAMTLMGAEVRKTFPHGYGTFFGNVSNIAEDVNNAAKILFEITYSDGDTEVIPYRDLKKILTSPMVSAASLSSVDGLAPALNSKTIEVPSLAETVADKYVSLLALASRRAAASYSPPAAGDSYAWTKIFKMAPADRDRHVKAMEGEMNKIIDAGHARWENLPSGEIAIPSVGVFRLKAHDLHNEGGGYTLKARFCANGQAAESPPGGWEATANVASVSQILTVLAIANELNLKTKQMDVRSAFTQVKLDDGTVIYVRPLPGLGDPEGLGRVLRLVNHLYGHPLANAAWAKYWVNIVTGFGFQIVDRLGTVFAYKRDDGYMLCATIVDDSAIAYDNDELFARFETYVAERVPITVTEMEHICGLRVRRDLVTGKTMVDQTEYILRKAKTFDIDAGGRHHKTPMDSDFKVGPRPDVPDENLVSTARKLLGSLIYATLTRPECKYAVSKLSTIATNPLPSEIGAMRRVLKYLFDTSDTTLVFTKGYWTGPDGKVYPPNKIVVFVDAGFGQEGGRRSQTGFVIMLNGAVIFAKSGRQTQLADSTGYAETIALHEATHYVVAYRRFMEKVFLPPVGPTDVREDNSAAVVFAKQGMGSRSMHYEIKYLYVTELQEQGAINVTKIGTLDQLGDVLTKPVPWDIHARLVPFLLGGPLIFSPVLETFSSNVSAGSIPSSSTVPCVTDRHVLWAPGEVYEFAADSPASDRRAAKKFILSDRRSRLRKAERARCRANKCTAWSALANMIA